MDDRDLLALEAATVFEMTPSGRILRRRSPDRPTPPRLWLAGCSAGNVVRIRHDVRQETAQQLEKVASDEPPLTDPKKLPVHFDEYVRLLSAEAPIEQSNTGLVWTFPRGLDYQHYAAFVASGSDEGKELLALLSQRGMPDALADLGFVDIGEFWAPWCAALDGGQIASIAFTVGLGPDSAEVGVATVPNFRGHGFAAAATAGWASLPELAGRSLFYATDKANLSSQRVTERLGLQLIGVTLTIT